MKGDIKMARSCSNCSYYPKYDELGRKRHCNLLNENMTFYCTSNKRFLWRSRLKFGSVNLSYTKI